MFTRESLAYESDVELRQIGRIERGEINTGLSTVCDIAETLNVELKAPFVFHITNYTWLPLPVQKL